MVNAPQFETLALMDSSKWLQSTRVIMDQDQWPPECIRCKQSESVGHRSIRQHFLDDHSDNQSIVSDYLVLGGVLDNICNSACQTCNENLSTKIGSLTSRNYIRINNSSKLDQLPLDRIVRLDINGGEPSASPNYLKLLENLPPNVKHVRLNTNGSRVLPSLTKLTDRGVKVTVTMSLDGVGLIHDYVRWPIKWGNFEQTLVAYQKMNLYELNTWTTVSALNIGNLKQIQDYVSLHEIKHSWALLDYPTVLNVRYTNYLTANANVPDELQHLVATQENNDVELQLFIEKQDRMRNIDIRDFYSKRQVLGQGYVTLTKEYF